MILTVLRGGGEYTPGHVELLRDQCSRHAPGVSFRCISDVSVPGRIEMKHDWPGWWSKLEMFRLPGPCLFMDLDTVIVGGLAPFLAVSRINRFTVLKDWNPQQRDVCSSLMAWSGDLSELYRTFAADPKRHMAANKSPRWWGDQGFIERHTKKEARSYWQSDLPGLVVSWKKNCRSGISKGARVVCFHGKPRPWDTDIYEQNKT